MNNLSDLISESGRTLKRMLSFDRKRVYSLSDGSPKDVRLLGQKGAALCELTQLGLPVPPGFIITTENFLEYVNDGSHGASSHGIKMELERSYLSALHHLEHQTGSVLGKPSHDGKKLPLLLAVRAGTAVIVPGLMDTILNVGLSDAVVDTIIQINPGLIHFTLDLHRRFISQYGVLVLRIPSQRYEKVLSQARQRDDVTSNDKLSTDSLIYVVSEFRRFTTVPENPLEQLKNIIEAMYEHSYTPRVNESLENASSTMPQIPRALSITVQAMVYGNLNKESGSGVAFSRRPGGNLSVPVGKFLAHAAGKEVLDGNRHPTPLGDLMIELPSVYEDLIHYMRLLEKHDHAIKYIEFTVEDGTLYILETSSVNVRPNMHDSRYVVYSDLLLHIQEEEEKLETEMEAEGKHAEHKREYYNPHIEEEKERQIEVERRSSHSSHHHCHSMIEEHLSMDEILEDEMERISTKSRKNSHK